MLRSAKVLLAVSATLVAMTGSPAQASGPAAEGWTTAWATAPAAAVNGVQQGYVGYTIRNVVHPPPGAARSGSTCPTASAPRRC